MSTVKKRVTSSSFRSVFSGDAGLGISGLDCEELPPKIEEKKPPDCFVVGACFGSYLTEILAQNEDHPT